MPDLTDAAYLRGGQYWDASNLEARVRLHARFSIHPQGLHRWVFDHRELRPQSRVLEDGCGPGYLWRENADRFPAGWRTVLSDLSTGMAREARRYLVGFPCRFACADVQALPSPAGWFDAVVASLVLLHVPDPSQAVAEMARVLRQEGLLAIVTMGSEHLHELKDVLARLIGPAGPVPGATGFTADHAEAVLHGCFRRVERIRCEDALRITEAGPIVE